MARSALKHILYLTAALLVTTSLAMAQKPKTVTIYTDAVLPNGQELKAGKYQVTVDEGAKKVTFTQGDKVVASHGCQVVPTPVKNDCNRVRFSETGNKKQQIQELRLGGERRSILLIQGGE